MSAPTVTLSPSSPAPGAVVTATVVRDIAKTTVTLTATEANGATSGPVSVPVVEPLTIIDASSPAHTWTLVSDDGTTAVYHTTA